MEFLIDLRFEDKGYNAIVHFVATFISKDENEAMLFYNDLKAGFKRCGGVILLASCYRIDNDKKLKDRSFEYYQFCQNRATATVEITQFILDNPDQNKTLVDNLTERLFQGKFSTAQLGNKYKIPVRVMDKETRNPISGELYYFTLEHLIPKK
ncbi:hypothetical protein ACS6L2_05975 [Aquirufa ecclesiirivi]